MTIIPWSPQRDEECARRCIRMAGIDDHPIDIGSCVRSHLKPSSNRFGDGG